MIDPVTDIAGCGAGHYVDGGITDYHFDWPFVSDGLILYPHFYPSLSPGWFDKSLPWRQRRNAPSSKLVLLSPTSSWVRSLPYGKIPDRKDFTKLSDQARLSYWQEVTERSFELQRGVKSRQLPVDALVTGPKKSAAQTSPRLVFRLNRVAGSVAGRQSAIASTDRQC